MDEGRGKRHGQMATWYLKHCSGISNCATKSQTDRSKSRRRGFGARIRYKHGLVEGYSYEARRMLGRSQKRFPNTVRRYPRDDIEVLGCLPGRPGGAKSTAARALSVTATETDSR